MTVDYWFLIYGPGLHPRLLRSSTFRRTPRRTFYALPSLVDSGHLNYILALNTAAAETVPRHRVTGARGRAVIGVNEKAAARVPRARPHRPTWCAIRSRS